MGIVIITTDDSDFLEGKYLIFYDVLDVIPDQPDVTYILRKKTTNEQEILGCLKYLQNKLVICVDKIPKIKEHEQVIISKEKKKFTLSLAQKTAFILRENDRLMVYNLRMRVPIPYALSFIRANVTDIEFHRRLAKVGFDLDDTYTHALFAYGIEPTKERTQWPKKKAKSINEPPKPFRKDDIYWEQIISLDEKVANQIRVQQKEKLPKGVKKSMQSVQEWV